MAVDQPDWVPPEVDIQRANPARVYDYWLGGTHNFLADQDAGRAINAIEPNTPALARANRAFLGRAVRFLAAAGVRQFLDIGSGIPTEGNVHEIAEQAGPGSRVVYVDADPVAIAHSKAILAGNEAATIVAGDLREPEKILADAGTQSLISFGEPVGLVLCSVMHFIADDEDPWRITRTLCDALVPGSYLVLSQMTFDDGEPSVARAGQSVYNRSVSTNSHARSRPEILRFFEGFELVDPGLVYTPQWRPEAPGDMPSDPAKFWILAAVGCKS